MILTGSVKGRNKVIAAIQRNVEFDIARDSIKSDYCVVEYVFIYQIFCFHADLHETKVAERTIWPFESAAFGLA